MKLSLIPFLVAVASAITLPVSEMDLDPQTAVEGKHEVRQLSVSWCFQEVLFD